MAERLERKQPVGERMVVIPPWPEEDDVRDVPAQENPFRAAHDLGGKRVILYSGTLGLANPVSTLLRAAEQFEDRPDLVFLFIGGGAGMAEIRTRNRPNVRWLPYQPFDQLRYSLAAGDVHVVNGCCVTHEAVRKTRQGIRRALARRCSPGSPPPTWKQRS